MVGGIPSKHLFRIASIIDETPRVRTFRLEPQPHFEINFKPGQFVSVWFAEEYPDMKNVRRAFSISSSPSETHCIEITVKQEGLFTNKLFGVNVGEYLWVLGPMGEFVLHPDLQEDVVFLAAGTGIAPFRSMIAFGLESGMKNQFFLLYSVKTSKDIIFLKEFEILQQKFKNFHVLYTITQHDVSWNGRRGRIDQGMIQEFLGSLDNKLYYTCGPLQMILAMETALAALGVDLGMFRKERWG